MTISSKITETEYCLKIAEYEFIYNLSNKKHMHDILHLLHSLINVNSGNGLYRAITVQMPAFKGNLYCMMITSDVPGSMVGIVQQKGPFIAISTAFTLDEDQLYQLYGVVLEDYNTKLREFDIGVIHEHFI